MTTNKIYGNSSEYDELKTWLEKNKPDALGYMYSRQEEGAFPIGMFSSEIDRWLIDNCPFKWLVDTLKCHYNLKNEEYQIKPLFTISETPNQLPFKNHFTFNLKGKELLRISETGIKFNLENFVDYTPNDFAREFVRIVEEWKALNK